MRAVEYLKNIGIDTLLAECNYNLKIVKAHLMRECNITDARDVNYAMKLVKKRLKEILQDKYSHSSVKNSILKVIKEGFENELF